MVGDVEMKYLDNLSFVCYKEIVAKRLVFIFFFLFLLPAPAFANDASPTPTPGIVNNVSQSGDGINISNNNNNQNSNSNTNNNNITISSQPFRAVAVPRTLPATGSNPSLLFLALLFGSIPLGLYLRRYGKSEV